MTCNCNKTNGNQPSSTTPRAKAPYNVTGCTTCKNKSKPSSLTDSLCNTHIYGDEYIMGFAWNKEVDCDSGLYKNHDFPVEILGWCPEDSISETTHPCNDDIKWERKGGYLIVRDRSIDGDEELMVDDGGQILYKRSSKIPAKALDAGYDARGLTGICDAIECCFDCKTIKRDPANGNKYTAYLPEMTVGDCFCYEELEDGTMHLDIKLEGTQTNSIKTSIEDCLIKADINVVDSSCITLAVTAAGLQAKPVISSDEGNILECRDNGLYAAAEKIDEALFALAAHTHDVPEAAAVDHTHEVADHTHDDIEQFNDCFLPQPFAVVYPTEPNLEEGIDFIVQGSLISNGFCAEKPLNFADLPQPSCEAPEGYCWMADIEIQSDSFGLVPEGSKTNVTMTAVFNGSTDTFAGTGTSASQSGYINELTGDGDDTVPDNNDTLKLNVSGLFNANQTGNTAGINYSICVAAGDFVSYQVGFNNIYITGRYFLTKCE